MSNRSGITQKFSTRRSEIESQSPTNFHQQRKRAPRNFTSKIKINIQLMKWSSNSMMTAIMKMRPKTHPVTIPSIIQRKCQFFIFNSLILNQKNQSELVLQTQVISDYQINFMLADCTQIFFPTDLLQATGYLIGFNTRGFSFTIIWVENSQDLKSIERKLAIWDKQLHIQHICGSELQILGFLGDKDNQIVRDTWLQIKTYNQSLHLEELMICSYKYKTKCTIILYDKPKPNQIIAYQDETDKYLEGKLKSALTLNPLVIYDQPIESFKIYFDHEDQNELGHSLIHINWRASILHEYFSISKSLKQSNNYYELFLRNEKIKPFIKSIIQLATLQSFVFKFYLLVMNYQIFDKSLSDVGLLSNTTKEVIRRQKTMNSWVKLTKELLSSHQPTNATIIINAYHKLISGFVFFFIDHLCGVLSLLLLYYNVTQLREFIHKYGSSIHIEVLSREVEWLMGFPAGLKTNRPLNIVLGQLIKYIIIFWNHLTTLITPYENILLRTIMIFGLFGLSFEIALTIDIISICTLHVYYTYKMLAIIYRWLWHITITCFRITRDKFMDQMRNKLDEHHFHWNQKILAMFLAFFLLMTIPTVSLYYFWFLVIVCFIYLVKSLLVYSIKLFSRFPLILIYSHYSLTLIPKITDLSLIKVEKHRVTLKLNYKSVPLTSIIILRKLLKGNQQFNPIHICKAIFIGQDIMEKREKKQHDRQQVAFLSLSQLLQL